jgi:hypothetical protein
MQACRHFGKRTLFAALITSVFLSVVSAQSTSTIQGSVSDSSGAVIPATAVTLSSPGATRSAQTQADGSYTFAGIAPGPYTISISIPGFNPFTQTVTVASGAVLQAPIQLSIRTDKQQVTVSADGGPVVTVQPDDNATAIVMRGADLDALPDDPDDLASALQALAGAGAGPNGGQIYIDGFSGGQLPPKVPSAKSGSIRIRSHQNTTALVSDASKSSPSREPITSMARFS